MSHTDGEQDATQKEGRQQEQQDDTPQPQEGEDAKTHGPQKVGSANEWRKALEAKDAQIAELQGKVSAATMTVEVTEVLNTEIA